MKASPDRRRTPVTAAGRGAPWSPGGREPPLRHPRVPWPAAALGFALVAMGLLHVAQPELDPVQEPVSFYAHGHHGWLLPAALVAFGAVGVLLAPRIVRAGGGRPAAFALAGFAAGLGLAAAVPSDPWFPWEGPWTPGGLVHAAAAVLAPPLLLIPLWGTVRPGRAVPGRRVAAVFLPAYLVALLGAGVSLLLGWARGTAPPAIGLAERGLALVATVWFWWVIVQPGKQGRRSAAT